MSTVKQFQKKPVVIQAVQVTGTPDNTRELIDWAKGSTTPIFLDDRPHYGKCISVNTTEGALWADKGDWIIKGVKGEFYPCKPDVFEATYTEVIPY